MKTKMFSNQGFSLVELAIGLAVIAILILAVSLSSGIRENARIQSATDSIQSLRAASENYIASGKLDYSGLTVDALKAGNFLPAGFTAAGSDPWGGDYTVGPDANDATKMDIAMTSINQTSADRLTFYFNNIANASVYDPGTTTWTVTF